MGTSLLFISQGSTFMVDAIEKNLASVGYNVVKAAPNVKELRENIDSCDVILIYLGDYIIKSREAFVFLKDTCIEQEKNINVIGDSMEMADLKQFIPEGLIENVFSRPLDIKKLMEVMEEVGVKTNANSRKKTILLVDDDPTFLRLIKDWLSENYKVIIVNSGMQAITYLANNAPDLILLDYEMPITTGPQVLEMIRTETTTAAIPVIFLTGKGDKESVTKVLALKPQGYILKNVGKEKLLSQIADFFESRKGHQY